MQISTCISSGLVPPEYRGKSAKEIADDLRTIPHFESVRKAISVVANRKYSDKHDADNFVTGVLLCIKTKLPEENTVRDILQESLSETVSAGSVVDKALRTFDKSIRPPLARSVQVFKRLFEPEDDTKQPEGSGLK